MALTIRPVVYYRTTARDDPGAAYGLLADLAERGVELLGFAATPVGPDLKQFTIFPQDANAFVAETRAAQILLDGPHNAILVAGDAGLHAIATVHEQLLMAGIEVYASSGASDSRGAFGYVLYVRESQFAGACGALGCDTPELRMANDWLNPRSVVRGQPVDRGAR
jgi:hypothetical protein